MNLLMEYLKKTNCEYQITFDNEVVCSENYKKIENSQILNNDVYFFDEKYYQKNNITIEIEGLNYNIIEYNDITKYVKEVMSSKIDCLTKLPNRMQVEKYLSKINNECIVVMSDIDDFKNINDIYGHQQGDSTIKLIGDLIKNTISINDFAGRYGGEEFLIIFNSTDTLYVKQTMEKINKILTKCTNPLNITISTGIYKFNPKKEKIEDAVKKADKALYYVKKHGKNAAIIFDETKK